MTSGSVKMYRPMPLWRRLVVIVFGLPFLVLLMPFMAFAIVWSKGLTGSKG